MSRGGASKDRTEGPERRCIVTGEVQPKHGLVRFVAGPDGRVCPDILGKLPGRGVYVSADRAALEKAAAKKLAVSTESRPPSTVTLPEYPE